MESAKMSKYKDVIKSIQLITDGNTVLKVNLTSFKFFDLNECEQVDVMLLCLRKQSINAYSPNLDQKSGEQAKKLRDEGNLKLQTSIDEGVKLYTESIAHAPQNSDTLSFGYANRAVALAQLKQYEAAIADNQRALIVGYPSELQYKLHSRLGKCYEAIGEIGRALTSYNISLSELENSKLSKLDQLKFKKDHIDPGLKICCAADVDQEQEVVKDITKDPTIGVPKFQIPNLGENFNPEVPSAADSVNLRYNDTFGRHFVANRNIEIGEPIIIEKPYAAFLTTEYLYTYCSHCFKRCLTLQPCTQCSWAMFCSNKCQDEAQIYHQVECAVIPSIIFNRLTAELESVSARAIFRYGIKATEDFFVNYEKPKYRTNQAKRTAGFNKDGKYISTDWNTLVNLCYHEEDNDRNVYFCMCLKAAQLLQKLKLDNGSTLSYKLGGFLLNILTSTAYNGATKILEYLVKEYKSKPVASAIYPTFALLNYSCTPNAIYHNYGDVLVLRALTSIKKGDQIFRMHGEPFLTNPFHIRHLSIQKELHYCCKCKACTYKWPLGDDLPLQPTFSLPREKTICEEISKAKENIFKNCAEDERGSLIVTKKTLPILKAFVELLEKYNKKQCSMYYSIINEIHLYYDKEGNHVGEIQDDGVYDKKPKKRNAKRDAKTMHFIIQPSF